MATDGAASVTMATPNQSVGHAEGCLKIDCEFGGEGRGGEGRVGAPHLQPMHQSTPLPLLFCPQSSHLPPLTSSHLLHLSRFSKHSLPFSSTALCHNHAAILFGHSPPFPSAPSHAQPTPHSPPPSPPLCLSVAGGVMLIMMSMSI